MGRDGGAEGFVAGDEGQTTGEVGHHQLGRFAHIVLIAFHGKVLGDNLLGGDAGNGHAAFHYRLNDFAMGTAHFNAALVIVVNTLPSGAC